MIIKLKQLQCMLSEIIKKKKQHKIEEQNIKLIINRLLLYTLFAQKLHILSTVCIEVTMNDKQNFVPRMMSFSAVTRKKSE